MLESVLSELAKQGYTEGTKQEGGTWPDLISDSLSGGLFDNRRYILVEEAAILGAMPENFAKFVTTSNDEQVAIVLVYGDDPRATHTKFFSKDVLKLCEISKPAPFPLWANERATWVQARARELSIPITRDGAEAIVDSLDTPEEIAAVLQNFRGFDKPVTASLVSDLVLDDGSKNMLRYIDSLCLGQTVQCLKVLDALSKAPTSDEVLIKTLSGLENRLRLCLFAKEQDSPVYARTIEAKKSYAWKMARACAAKHTPQTILNFLTSVIALSISRKSGTGGNWGTLVFLTTKFLSTK